MKQINSIHDPPRSHWVGNGFPVRSLFSYHAHAQALSPFLLLDRAGPAGFAAGNTPRGVGQHPHRGFETVTIVYEGEVAHRDSTGQGGLIGPGDVQWMTAASGILHEEFHSERFVRSGGVLDMVQLWVNLPARDKMAPPRYQAIASAQIPEVKLPDAAGSLRVIAGEYAGQQGAARTFSPLNVWDVRLSANSQVVLPASAGWTTAIVVLHGAVQVGDDTRASEGQMVLLERAGTDFSIAAEHAALVLVLSGTPLDEPVVGYGPFVMNSAAEIEQAIADFSSGQFGRIAH
jgi:redox-sensitive bicupin YhaK (pirin superfamily)